jgi:pyruvate dehydrogenase E2 component (dihydrolipoamide acetyltransferase)
MDILMPQLGETVAEGKITKWFRKTGDAIRPGENLFEIETDKVSMEVPSTSAGVLSEIRVQAGEVAPVGAIVAVISGAGESAASAVKTPASTPAVPKPAAPRMAATPAPRPAARTAPGKLDPFFEVRTPEGNFGPAKIDGRQTTPLARRLAKEAGIDLLRIQGSGPHGRIIARDVQSTGTARMAAASIAASPSSAEIKALYANTPHEEIPLDGMRRIIATRLVQAKQAIPHFYLTMDVDAGALLKLREEANKTVPRDREGNPAFKLSMNDFIIKAWAWALQSVPAANVVFAEDKLLRFRQSDIAVAVALDGGLVTPVIRNAETKTVGAISQEMSGLAARARARKLKPAEYQGGSSAISNLGMYGVREFAAIINPPHATILAAGAVRRQAVELTDGGIGFASVMTATLSCDHRAVDGALGAELLGAFRKLVEKPASLLA